MFKRMTKKGYREADRQLENGIREFEQACKFRDAMTNIFAVKTKYQDVLERVHSRLMEGERKVADVKGAPFAEMTIKGKKQTVRVMQIGANSCGLEVKISRQGDWEWTALEQFGKHQQRAIAAGIDWTTLQ